MDVEGVVQKPEKAHPLNRRKKGESVGDMIENQIEQEEVEIDIRDIFYLLKAHIIQIIFVGILAALLAGVGTKCLITPQYTSTSKLYISGKGSVISSLADLQVGTQLTKDYAELVQSRVVMEDVIKKLDLDMEYQDLLGITTVSNTTDTRILVISVTYPDPKMAKKIVDEIANVTKKRISEIMEAGEPKIVEKGYVEDIPSSPNLMKNVVLGGICGVALTIFILIIRYILDDKIKSQEDIEKYLQLNTLAMIPLGEEEYDGKKKKGIRRWKK